MHKVNKKSKQSFFFLSWGKDDHLTKSKIGQCSIQSKKSRIFLDSVASLEYEIKWKPVTTPGPTVNGFPFWFCP